MIFAIDSGLDLTLTLLVLVAVVAGAVRVAVWRSPSRPAWRSFAGGAAVAAAAFVLVTSVGGDIELRQAMGASAAAVVGDQWPAWLAAASLAAVGVLALRWRYTAAWRSPKPLRTTETLRLAVGVLAVVAAVVFALPVWDFHDGWAVYHGHTYFGRGFHFH